MDKIKVLVIDSNVFYRTGIKQVISQEPDLEAIESGPLDSVNEIVETEYPDIIMLGGDLMDGGLTLATKLRRRYPSIRLVILSTGEDDKEIFNAVKLGAVAYINKNCDVKQLVATIRETFRGKYPINDSIFSRPKVAEQVLLQFQKLNRRADESVAAPITQRETQILTYICNGNSNKQIADLLNISEQTIKNHVSSILRKLNANDRAHAAMLAVRRGLISLEDLE